MWRLKRQQFHKRLLLQWHVTERCNLHCAHCYQSACASEPPLAELLIVLDQYRSLLSELDAAGHITVTGGEPFLRTDFLQLLEVIAMEKPRIGFAILTNGTLIDPHMAKRLRKLGPRFVQVSIDGVEQTHDRLRGSGNFAQVCAGVRALVAEKVPALISFTAHRLNYREFPEVARLGKKLGATRVWADRLIPIGRGSDLQTLSPNETKDLVEIMCDASHDQRSWFNKTRIPMHRALQFLGGGTPYRCTAGDTLITVQPNGDVYPCRRLPLRAGNVKECSLTEIYKESDLLKSLRDRSTISQGCESCAHEPQCGGGLRCLAHAQFNSPFHADPGCWLAPRSIPTQAEQ